MDEVAASQAWTANASLDFSARSLLCHACYRKEKKIIISHKKATEDAIK